VRAVAWKAVNFAVGRHHARETRDTNCGLEGDEDFIKQLSAAHVYRRLVEAALAKPMAHEMLARCDYTASESRSARRRCGWRIAVAR
jgi:hypothetical protein